MNERRLRSWTKRLKGIGTILTALVLTARIGKLNYQGHIETYYNLKMDRVVQNAQDAGIPCEYWVDEDGIKRFGPWIIVASHPSVTRYSFVETSRGTGIVLDRHNIDDPNLYDIAVDW